VERATTTRQPAAQTKSPHSNTSNLLQTKDGGALQTDGDKKASHLPAPDPDRSAAKAPTKLGAIPPSTKSEDDQVIEAMDFLSVLEILEDYNVLSDR
jgi:hypothetical protein